MQHRFYLIFLCAGLVLGCAPEQPPHAVPPAATTHDLGPLTVRLPRTWQARDYAQSGLESTDKGPHFRRYLFVHTASVDTALRETLVVMVDQRGRTPRAATAAQEFVHNLRATPDQLRVLQLRDTLLHQGQAVAVETTCRYPQAGVDVVQTYAFLAKGNALVMFMGTAPSHPGLVDEQNRRLFRRAIESLAWK